MPDQGDDVLMDDVPTFSDDDVSEGFGDGSEFSGDSGDVPGDKGKEVVGRPRVATAQAPGSGRGESTAGAGQELEGDSDRGDRLLGAGVGDSASLDRQPESVVRRLELTTPGGLESLAGALEVREAELRSSSLQEDVANDQRLYSVGGKIGRVWQAAVDRGLVPAALSGVSEKVLRTVAKHIVAKTPSALQAVGASELAGLVNDEGESRIPLAGWLAVLAHVAEGSGNVVAGGVETPDGRLTFERLEEVAREFGDAAEVERWALPPTGEVHDETKNREAAAREAAAWQLARAKLAVVEASKREAPEALGRLQSREQEVVKTFVAHVLAMNPVALRVMAKTEAFRAAESWGNTDGWVLNLGDFKKSKDFAATLLDLVAGALPQGAVPGGSSQMPQPGSAEGQKAAGSLPAGLREVVSALDQDELRHLQSALRTG
ncbi:hypothetical protein AB0H34_47895, partial [Saccharopolyspora shandongensis]|uniref:hypothetical protein n=1 Tax=Saccharopolyspora shandongensis TaxID=418495 RepID=UPI0033DA39AE